MKINFMITILSKNKQFGYFLASAFRVNYILLINMIRLFCLILIITGCALRPWEKFSELANSPPDSSCQTGNVSGYDIWIWECHNGERIVVYQVSSEMSRGEASVEKVACNKNTPFELEHNLKKHPNGECRRELPWNPKIK